MIGLIILFQTQGHTPKRSYKYDPGAGVPAVCVSISEALFQGYWQQDVLIVQVTFSTSTKHVRSKSVNEHAITLVFFQYNTISPI